MNNVKKKVFEELAAESVERVWVAARGRRHF
jgi:hypothetical protein